MWNIQECSTYMAISPNDSNQRQWPWCFGSSSTLQKESTEFFVTTINNAQYETTRVCTSKLVISQMLYIRLPFYDAWSDLKGVRLMDWKKCVILAAVKWNETKNVGKGKKQAQNG